MDKYTRPGVYNLTCPDCNKGCVGQTAWRFLARYNEKNKLSETIAILQNLLNTVEHYYIYTEFAANNHLNDSQNILPNPIFDAILKTHQQ